MKVTKVHRLKIGQKSDKYLVTTESTGLFRLFFGKNNETHELYYSHIYVSSNLESEHICFNSIGDRLDINGKLSEAINAYVRKQTHLI